MQNKFMNVTIQNNYMLVFVFIMTFFYSLMNRNWYDVSSILQGLISVTLLFLVLSNGGRIEKNQMSLSIFVLFPFFIFFQKHYVLNIISFLFLYEMTKYFKYQVFFQCLIIYSFTYSIFSIVFFQALEGFGFYKYVNFNNQIFPFINRLLGLDGSPVSVSLVCISGLISSLYIKKKQVSHLLLLFFLVILFWSGSRTVFISLFLSFFLAFITKDKFLLLIIFIISSPFILTYFYFNFDNQSMLWLIEKITSYRVVNWVNALLYYLESGYGHIFFGVGHLPVLDKPYLTQSLLDGYYRYKYVTYTESGILRILVNYGLIYFIIFFSFIINFSMRIKKHKERFVLISLLMIATLYDPVFSIQFFFVLMMLFYTFTINKYDEEQ